MGRIRGLLARGIEAAKNFLNLPGSKVSDWTIGRDDWVQGGMWVDVSSSCVEAIRYSKEDRVLYVRFKKTGVYKAEGIQPQAAINMFSSSSMGKFVWHQGLRSILKKV
jgi:hypothetical protein